MENKEDPEQKHLNACWSNRIHEFLYMRLFLRHIVERLESAYGIRIDFEAVDKEVTDLRDKTIEELMPQLIKLQNEAALFRQVEEIFRGKNK